MIKANYAFYQEMVHALLLRTVEISPELLDVLNAGIVLEAGYVILGSQIKNLERAKLAFSDDETGVECFVNHVHLDDYMSFSDKMEAQAIAIMFSDLIITKLRNLGVCARIIIALNGKADVTVRFHRIRPMQSFLSEDLDVYEETIIVLDV